MIENLLQDLAQAQTNQNLTAQVGILIRLGSLYYSKHQYNQALDYYQRSLAIAQTISDQYSKAIALLSLGWVYQKLEAEGGQYEQMLASHHQCLEISQSINDQWLIGSSSVSLGRIYLELKQYNQAIDYAQQGLAIAQEIHHLSLELNALVVWRHSYEALGQTIPLTVASVIPSGQSILAELGINPEDLKVNRHNPHRVYYRAVINWLTKYHPPHDTQNLEQTKGYLESFHHLCEAGNWKAASALISVNLNTPTLEEFHNQLKTWGYYTEQAKLYENLLFKVDPAWDTVCLNGLANVCTARGEYAEAIALQEQHAEIAAATQDQQSEGYALGNIGLNHYYLGQYTDAIDYQRSLELSQELQNQRGEATMLGNLGTTLLQLEQYPEAQNHLLTALEKSREILFSANEALVLQSLAELHQKLGQLEQAMEYCNEALVIANELNTPLLRDCHDLAAQLSVSTSQSEP